MRSYLYSKLVLFAIALATECGLCTLIVQGGLTAGVFTICVIVGGLLFGALIIISVVLSVYEVFQGRVLSRRQLVFTREPYIVDLNILPLPCKIWVFFEQSTDHFFGEIIVRAETEPQNFITLKLNLPRIQPSHQRLFWFGITKYREFWPKYFGKHFDPLGVKVWERDAKKAHIRIDLELGSNLAGTIRERQKNGQGDLLIVARSMSGESGSKD